MVSCAVPTDIADDWPQADPDAPDYDFESECDAVYELAIGHLVPEQLVMKALHTIGVPDSPTSPSAGNPAIQVAMQALDVAYATPVPDRYALTRRELFVMRCILTP